MKRPVHAFVLSTVATVLVAGAVNGQDDQPDGPAWFTGTSSGTPIVFEPTVEVEPGVWMDRRDGEVHGVIVETSDERFGGDWSATFHEDEWPVSLGDREEIVGVERYTVRLENEGGAWTGNGTFIQHFLAEGGEVLGGASEGLHVLHGEGGYEGLTAYVTYDFMTEDGQPDIRGVILPEPPTDFPDPPAPAATSD